MIDVQDFSKKQIIFIFPTKGDKLSYSNDNIVVRDCEGKIKYQSTCYRLFMIFVIGDMTFTTGIVRKAHKYGFAICFMSMSFKVYEIIGTRMEGNTLLRKHQYSYEGLEIAKEIVANKIENQKKALSYIRKKTPGIKEAIEKLDLHICKIKEIEDVENEKNYNLNKLMGIEGSAARTYFAQIFNNTKWNGRKPRIKNDYINATLDIGYTMLFNFVDSILKVYGFDTYCGVFHKCFYMRKSLSCDIMESMRPVIDYEIRKAVNLGMCKEEDFEIFENRKYVLKWKKVAYYTEFIMQGLLDYKDEIFIYIQSYYRIFMKRRYCGYTNGFPKFKMR